MARTVTTPAACSSRNTGSTLAAKVSAAARPAAAPWAWGSGQIGMVAQMHALRLLCGQGSAGAVGDHRALFLGQGGIDVQHVRWRYVLAMTVSDLVAALDGLAQASKAG